MTKEVIQCEYIYDGTYVVIQSGGLRALSDRCSGCGVLISCSTGSDVGGFSGWGELSDPAGVWNSESAVGGSSSSVLAKPWGNCSVVGIICL